MKSILDPSFRYVSSTDTDIRKTFARVRREQRSAAEALAKADAENQARVQSIFEARRRGVKP